MPSERKSKGPLPHYGLGIFLLAIALLAALTQVLDALGAVSAPGCGLRGGCHAASASEFGRWPILGWPLSYVGLAWFAGLLVVWIRTRGALGEGWKWLVRAGVAASLFYAGVLAGRKFACPYCIAVHVANVLFLVVVELRGSAGAPAARKSAVHALGTVAAVGVVLGLCHAWFSDAARQRAESDLGASTQALRAAGTSDVAEGFTGRHRRGPAEAQARVVVFTDYQCEDCHTFEAQLERALAGATDVALSVRHFPMCTQCNPHASNLHPNACWAARAAEAASIVGGDEGFWRMHRWLFERRGSFTDKELDAGLAALGFERVAFLTAMHSNETLERVKADIELGMRHGLDSTPMVFVNGVELRGRTAPNALERVLAEVHSNPAAARTDQPPTARERCLAVWREAPRVELPVDTRPHVLGRADAKVKVVVFGDYQEPNSCAVDVELRNIALSDPRVSYAFRCYPVNKACNSTVELDLHPLACLAALGAEAAGILQGEDGFWALHDWIVTHRSEFNDGTLTKAAEELGMKRDDYWNAVVKPEIEFWLREDVLAAKQLGVQSIPLVFVDGRRVERWMVDGQSLLPTIVAEAAR